MTPNVRLFDKHRGLHNLRDPKTGQLRPIPPDLRRVWPQMDECSREVEICPYCVYVWQLILVETKLVEQHRIGP